MREKDCIRRAGGHHPGMTNRSLATIIAQGAGREPADLVIRNVRLYDLVTGDLTPTDIAVCGDRIVGTHAAYEGRRPSTAAGASPCPASSTRISMSNLAADAARI